MGDKPKFKIFLSVSPYKTPFFMAEDGNICLQKFGDTLGTGKTENLGSFWGKLKT